MSYFSSPVENAARGARLARIRQLRKLSQTEFSEKLGLSLRACRNYEQGEREMPVGVLHALFQVFGVDPLWMLIGDQEGKYSPIARPDGELLEKIYVKLANKLINDNKKRDPILEAKIFKHIYMEILERGYDYERINNFMNLVA